MVAIVEAVVPGEAEATDTPEQPVRQRKDFAANSKEQLTPSRALFFFLFF